MNPWAHLPNAVHIDRVLVSLKANPGVWEAPAPEAEKEKVARDAARRAAWKAVDEAARDAVWDAARDAVWDAACDAVWDAACDAACDAVLALVAYDDCSHMLDSDIGELKILAALGVPVAILLLPACIAFAKEKELV